MSVSYDFTGQVALVTGGASGMGLATAKAFAQAGAAVAIVDRNVEAAQAEAAQAEAAKLVAAGHRAIGIGCDVSDEAQAAAAVAQAVAAFGRLDMAFNNAGIQVPPTKRPRISTASTASTCAASGPS